MYAGAFFFFFFFVIFVIFDFFFFFFLAFPLFPHPLALSLMHISLTHSTATTHSTQPLIHSTHPLTHSTHPLTHSPTHPLTHSAQPQATLAFPHPTVTESVPCTFLGHIRTLVTVQKLQHKSRVSACVTRGSYRRRVVRNGGRFVVAAATSSLLPPLSRALEFVACLLLLGSTYFFLLGRSCRGHVVSRSSSWLAEVVDTFRNPPTNPATACCVLAACLTC